MKKRGALNSRRPPGGSKRASWAPLGPLLAHPSHVSWPHSSTEGPSAAARMRHAHPIRHTPHTFRGPIGSSTEGPSAAARMRPAHPIRHAPHKFRGPIGSSTEGPSAAARMRHTPNSAHPSHVSWPHRALMGAPHAGPHGSQGLLGAPSGGCRPSAQGACLAGCLRPAGAPLPMGPRHAVLGGGGTHAIGATGTFGGAPYGATKRCPGWGGRMQSVPLGPSVELPMGLRNV